jgi:phage terminase small subunit
LSNRLSQEKAQAIAIEYMTNGQKKAEALETVGYSKSYAYHNGLKLFDNDRVKAEIAKIQAKTDYKCEITVKEIVDRFERIAKACETKRPTDAIKANELIGKHLGIFEKDNRQRGQSLTDIMARVMNEEGK